jgi:signal transduction histidine kinase
MGTGTSVPGRWLRILYSLPLNWIAVVLAVLGLGGTYALYTKLEVTESQHLARRTATELGHVGLEILSGVGSRLQPLHELVDWWIYQGRPLAAEDWKTDSRLFLDRADGLTEARWVDTRLRTRWSVRPGGVPTPDVRPLPAEMRPCLDRARKHEEVLICGPVRAGELFAAVPGNRGGITVGYLVGVYAVPRLLHSVLDPGLPDEYDVTVFADGAQAYRHPSSSAQLESAQSMAIRLLGDTWTLTLALPMSSIATERSWVMGFGLIVTALLFLAMRIANTSRRRALALTDAYAALTEEERARQRSLADFQTLLDVVPIGIAVAHDPECRTIWSNPAAANMMGVPQEQNISMSGPESGSLPYKLVRQGVEVPPEDLPMQRAARTASAVLGEELDIVRADGTVVRTLAYAAPLFDERGKVRGVVNACVDVTGQKHAEEERKLLLERLQRSEKFKSLALMAGGMAHDFNNLLTAIMGHAALASNDPRAAGEIRSHLAESIRASERAAALVRQLLAYSGHAMPLQEATNIDISAVVSGMRDEIRAAAPAEAAIELHLADPLPPVRGRPSELREVLRNVVANAVDALAEGSGMIHIQTAEAQFSAAALAALFPYEDLQPGRYVRLEVRDTGCGMSPEVARSIFDPFFTTKFTGRGLGLSAAQGIVKAHRGAIRVESAVGQGTRVEIVFPVAQE